MLTGAPRINHQDHRPAQNLAEVGISGQTLAASCWPAPEPRGPAAPAHVQLPAQFGDAEHAPAQLPAHGPGKGTQAALETGAMHAVGYTKIIPAFRCVSPQPVLPSQSAGNPPGTATLHRQRRRRWWWPGLAVSAVQTAAAAVPPAGPGWPGAGWWAPCRVSEPRLRLKGTPASLPLPVTRRCEREPAQQPSQRLFNLEIEGGPRALRLIRGRIHPVGRTPDAHIDARLRSINTAAVLASPDDHGLGRRKQIIIPAPRCGPGASQE